MVETPATNGESRKKPYTWKDAALTYLTEGRQALEKRLVGHTDPVTLLEDIIDNLNERDQDVKELEDLTKVFRSRTDGPGRGRKAVSLGTVRDYSVQQIINQDGELGEPFIKLPVATLGLIKGNKGRVSFTLGKIVVTTPMPKDNVDDDVPDESMNHQMDELVVSQIS